MIAKFFRGGRTYKGAQNAIRYLLDPERVKNGTARLIKGDPATALNIIRGIGNKWKFTSGVLSFSELLQGPDADRIKKEIIEDFERVFFPGLQAHEYDIMWVEHTDKGRTELHFLIPRLHLTTGKAYNPYFVGRDFRKKDLWQDYINLKYGFTSPHDPKRQRATKEQNPRWKVTDRQLLQKQIDEYVADAIIYGLVNNRDDVVYLLEQSGLEVTRKGKTYISVKTPEMSKAIRLKGDYYAESFRSVAALERAARDRAAKHTADARADSRDAQTKRAEVREKLNTIVGAQAKYNRRKYADRNTQQPARPASGDREEYKTDNSNSINIDPARSGRRLRPAPLRPSSPSVRVKKLRERRDDGVGETLVRGITAARARTRAGILDFEQQLGEAEQQLEGLKQQLAAVGDAYDYRAATDDYRAAGPDFRGIAEAAARRRLGKALKGVAERFFVAVIGAVEHAVEAALRSAAEALKQTPADVDRSKDVREIIERAAKRKQEKPQQQEIEQPAPKVRDEWDEDEDMDLGLKM